MPERIARSPADLHGKLVQQVGFLERSAALYDSGCWDEAARLATSIRILVHDARSDSLLTILGLRSTLRFADTALYRQAIDQFQEQLAERARIETGDPSLHVVATRPEAGLAEARWFPDGTLAWMPRLATGPSNPAQDFKTWWSSEVIEASDSRTYSREDVVKVMANQDGGAHVDPRLDAAYHALLHDDLGIQTARPEDQGQDWTMSDPPGGWVSPKGNVTHATVRQVAHEVLLTLEPLVATSP